MQNNGMRGLQLQNKINILEHAPNSDDKLTTEEIFLQQQREVNRTARRSTMRKTTYGSSIKLGKVGIEKSESENDDQQNEIANAAQQEDRETRRKGISLARKRDLEAEKLHNEIEALVNS